MKYEKINKNYTKIIVSFIVIIIIGSVLVLNITKAKYRTTVSVPIVSGTVNYSGGYDFKVMALYQQKEGNNCTDINSDCYDSIDRMPTTGYTINTKNSYCTINSTEKDDIVKLYTEDGKHIIENLAKNEKCYLYFDINFTKDTIITNSSVMSRTPYFDGTACLGDCTYQDENGLFKTEDDFGISYYFRGTVNDNWVKFGKDKDEKDIWWRIIRINGDGTIRLIYSGIYNDGEIPNQTDAQTQINSSTYKFNPSVINSMYVGYQYENGQGRGHKDNSEALKTLITWFSENLMEEWSEGNGRIDINAGFCNDRSGSTDRTAPWSENMDDTLKIDDTLVYYGAHLRLEPDDKTPGPNHPTYPTLKCGIKNYKDYDYFTYTESTGIESITKGKINGTQSLEYPVGLITADEIEFAGAIYGKSNSNFWLYTGKDYWTMSPYYYYNFHSNVSTIRNLRMYTVGSSGNISWDEVDSERGLRPVINLKADTTFSFEKADEPKGTSTNPYIVS